MDIILDDKKRYTYADYLTWLDDKRRELLDGFIRLMSPAPTTTHAQISRVIFVSFVIHIEKNNGNCQALLLPSMLDYPKSLMRFQIIRFIRLCNQISASFAMNPK